jgi:hypothetical protein
MHGTQQWLYDTCPQERDFAEDCIAFYLSTSNLLQKSIFTFLLFWNQTTGVKEVGQMIGKLVWEEEWPAKLKWLWK